MVYGTVASNKDPTGCGRVKVNVPALGTLSQWFIPAGWPGAGGLSQGTQFPVPFGAQIMVFFEQGDIKAGGAYIPLHYGQVADAEGGATVFPTRVAERKGQYGANSTLKCATLWEDDYFRIFVDFDKVGVSPNLRNITIEEKHGGSTIQMDAAAGANGKSSTITIYGRTNVNIQSEGAVSITGGSVSIQGRRVLSYGKKPI
jgi:hypothetical protein